MTSTATTMHLVWEGPYAWPGFESAGSLPPLPKSPGVYIQACDYKGGYLILGCGITRRPVAHRLREHTRKFLNGEITVLDIPAAQAGIRREIWHGWGEARRRRDEFENRKGEIQEAARQHLAGIRIFLADPSGGGKDSRLRERFEAALMDDLYKHAPPICDLPDRGTLQMRRRPEETPVLVSNSSSSHLHGLSPELLI